MKTQIIRTAGTNLNHNQGGIKIKPQLSKGTNLNHNQSTLIILN